MYKSELIVPVFFQNWYNYKTGFGSMCSDYWLGLDYMHSLTLSGGKSLYIEMYRVGTPTKYDVLYSGFSVGPESSKYVLSLGAKTNGSLDDFSVYQSGNAFATYDNDNSYNYTCGNIFSGAGGSKHATSFVWHAMQQLEITTVWLILLF